MNVISPLAEQSEPRESCVVVILYEDASSRQRAMAACEFLRGQLAFLAMPAFHWWRTDFLGHATLGRAAARQAAKADFLIVCSYSETLMSPAIRQWFENWIAVRDEREGAILDLTKTGRTGGDTGLVSPEPFLRWVARRAGLDYFTNAPPSVTGTLPASYEEAERRASQTSSILDEILKQPPRPPSFGLND